MGYSGNCQVQIIPKCNYKGESAVWEIAGIGKYDKTSLGTLIKGKMPFGEIAEIAKYRKLPLRY